MKMDKSLDWLTATRTNTTLKSMAQFLPASLEIDAEIESIPRFETAFSLKPSGILAHSVKNAMCMMIVLTGSDLRVIRDSGISTDHILAEITAEMNSITRLDYAVDVYDRGALPIDVLSLWKNGEIKTHYRTVQNFETLTGFEGQTVYFGSKNSDQRIRIYNKAAEQQMEGTDWLRIELQARKQRSTNLANDMVKYGMARAGDTRLKELLKIQGLAWWEEALNSEEVQLSKGKRELSQWQKWMRTQVLPSVQTRVAESKENADFMREWLFRVELLLLGAQEIDH